jgi:NAD(P)-dependent dehydrogenase (short-subunit alcohol dehydrogenase family)
MNQTMRFEGKTAIVTGGAGGIGTAICQRLAGEGAFVVVTDTNSQNAEKVAADIQVVAQLLQCLLTFRTKMSAHL